MHPRRSLAVAGLLLALAGVVSGCHLLSRSQAAPVMPEPPAPRPVTLTLRGTPDLNQGNAVVVRVYTLRGNTALPQTTLPELWQDDAAALRGDLVGREELRLYPGSTQDITIEVPAGVTHLAVVANLREAAGHDWMHVFTADELWGRGAVVIIGSDRVVVAEG